MDLSSSVSSTFLDFCRPRRLQESDFPVNLTSEYFSPKMIKTMENCYSLRESVTFSNIIKESYNRASRRNRKIDVLTDGVVDYSYKQFQAWATKLYDGDFNPNEVITHFQMVDGNLILVEKELRLACKAIRKTDETMINIRQDQLRFCIQFKTLLKNSKVMKLVKETYKIQGDFDTFLKLQKFVRK